MYDVPTYLWIAFVVIVVVGLAVDLLAHKDDHVIGFKEAAAWSAGWVGLAILWGVMIFILIEPSAGAGPDVGRFDAGLEYTTAWLLEKSLSVDNLFVFAVIFGYFKVPAEFQHRVLFYGVIGALVFRGIFLALGVAVVSTFTFVLFGFAALLLYSSFKLFFGGEGDDYDPGKSVAVRTLRKIYPTTEEYHGTAFFIKENGKRIATPLLAVVVAIEAADLIFAVDSVPAVLAVTSDPFIVYTSNAFAILGLRALYFLLSGLLTKFHLLGKGVALVLGFIGLKLTLQATHEVFVPGFGENVPTVPNLVSLAVITLLLAGSIILSIKFPLPPEDEPESGLDTGAEQAASHKQL